MTTEQFEEAKKILLLLENAKCIETDTEFMLTDLPKNLNFSTVQIFISRFQPYLQNPYWCELFLQAMYDVAIQQTAILNAKLLSI